jgi:DNA invertase Pin-like site-specific DNA recombinase
MAVYGYARVSTARQASEGESLEVQSRVMGGYAQMQGLRIDRVFVERGVSGSKPLAARPEGAALLASLGPGDAVITAKLDRMFRSALDALDVLARLGERGVAVHMIDLGGDVVTNGISKLVFTILSAVAEAERDRIRERVAVVKADQRARGRYLGGAVPFGWRVADGGELVEVPEQQDAIRRMRELRAAEASLRRIRRMARGSHAVARGDKESAGRGGCRLAGGGSGAGEDPGGPDRRLPPSPARNPAGFRVTTPPRSGDLLTRPTDASYTLYVVRYTTCAIRCSFDAIRYTFYGTCLMLCDRC